ncbi:MAG TPA: hypothetical protein VMU16_13940 [Candidatus Binataceae bacterium]|nr:hypothetical protein [Candidatus Binataceae bacterium]
MIAKVREELDEIDAALARADHTAAAEEIGDLMLAISNAPRFIGHGAERTLHRACEKFAARFDSAVRLANARGLKLKLMTPAGLEALWQEAKKLPPGRANRSR